MRSASVKAGSGRVVVALLGLLFMKALGDVLIVPGGTRGRQAEAIEPMPEPARDVRPSSGGSGGEGTPSQGLDESAGSDAAN